MKLKALALVALVAGVAALTGCETMSAEECKIADWRSLGSESCGERGFSADPVAYNVGFDAGMYQFCRPENGFSVARRGASFSGACPRELAGEFYLAYQDGQRVRVAEQSLQSARDDVSRITSERSRIDDDIRARENNLRDATTDEDRRRHRSEIERLQRERRNLNDDLRVAQSQIPSLQRAVDDLRYEIGARWGAW
jgi:hypothetical protein